MAKRGRPELTQLLSAGLVQSFAGCLPLESIRSAEDVAAPDLEETPYRWPVFVPLALERGFLSVYAIPLTLRGVAIGGLNLFSEQLSVPVEGAFFHLRRYARNNSLGLTEVARRVVLDQL